MSIARQGICTADVPRGASPFLVWLFSIEVAIQQVWRDIELVVAVPLSADCFAIACRAMVVTLYFFDLSTQMLFSRSDEGSADDLGDHLLEERDQHGGVLRQRDLLQFFGHSGATITAQR